MDARDQILSLFQSLPVEGRAPLLAALALTIVGGGQGAAASSGPHALLTPDDVAGVLKVSRHTVYDLLRRGRIRSIRFDGQRLWGVRPSDLAAYQQHGSPVVEASRARGPRRPRAAKAATESRARGPRRVRDTA